VELQQERDGLFIRFAACNPDDVFIAVRDLLAAAARFAPYTLHLGMHASGGSDDQRTFWREFMPDALRQRDEWLRCLGERAPTKSTRRQAMARLLERHATRETSSDGSIS